VLIYLHGKDKVSQFNNFIGIIDKYIQSGGYPIILVEPKDETAPFWGKDFDYQKLLEIVNSKLEEENIQIQHISVIGHSAAGCNTNGGIYKVVKEENLLHLVGLADACYNKKYANILTGENIPFIINIHNKETGGGWPQGSRNFEEFEKILEIETVYTKCDKAYEYCYKNTNNRIISFQANAKHNEIPEVLLKEALFPTHNLFKLFLPPNN